MTKTQLAAVPETGEPHPAIDPQDDGTILLHLPEVTVTLRPITYGAYRAFKTRIAALEKKSADFNRARAVAVADVEATLEARRHGEKIDLPDLPDPIDLDDDVIGIVADIITECGDPKLTVDQLAPWCADYGTLARIFTVWRSAPLALGGR